MIFKSKAKYSLHSAIQDGDIKKVKQLINRIVHLSIQNIKTVLLLYLCALKYKNLPIAEILLSNGANVNAQDNDGTLLYILLLTQFKYIMNFRKISYLLQ
ncbi:ankyrin repeat family protein [Orientia tsutsugamushi str. Gilliam]|uniref:Ankyrin repeat family protein n=1 Tax=Orientia tsutsugamushi str. Gilliam TaxID=1359184 RepID=A0A0F3M9M8_ORITS|nr:ankyrin repeat domain-containing protein [Orientia tsutsugamushi]KJV51299.1 ankyrin repeat family protein [Orientia tsutsugamushi str. Gilliam]